MSALLKAVAFSALCWFCLAAAMNVGDKTECEYTGLPGGCTAKVTYEVVSAPDECGNSQKIKITAVLNCGSVTCTRIRYKCHDETSDVEFNCEGQRWEIALGNGRDWGEMATGDDGAQCSDGTVQHFQ